VSVLDRASSAHRIVQASPYHGSGRPGRAAIFAPLALAAILGLGSGACSMSMELGSLFSDKDEEKALASKGDPKDVTGSLPLQAKRNDGSDGVVNPADWSHATVALREALGNNEEGSSIPWQNAATGNRGTVTPVASAFVKDGFACRNFLASHVGNGRENWFEGTACRVHRGQWDIRSTRPLDKS
jgi:surface antigen